MNNVLKKYLQKTYSNTFFPIFLTLYTITSIIFLVKIASLTSVIQINFFELLELYSYNIATILFYTIPISLFISLGLSLAKLSSEYELIVITSFGLNPLQILKMFLPLLLSSSILVLIISLTLVPKSTFLKETFLVNKKTEAQFNIKANEYGQQFGTWLIYVEKEQNGLYEDVVLYQQNKEEDVFIIAKYAQLHNMKTSLNLSLNDGKVVKVGEKVSQIDFKRMVLNNELEQTKDIQTFRDLLNYWKDKGEKFSFNILSSIFPLVSAFFIIYIGFFNPRYNKNYSTVIGIAVTIIFVVLTKELTQEFQMETLYYFPIIWIIVSFLFYRYKIKPYY
jgi:lipopolysaccharide export system permease protein